MDDLVKVFKAAWHEADEAGEVGHRVEAGLSASLSLALEQIADDLVTDAGVPVEPEDQALVDAYMGKAGHTHVNPAHVAGLRRVRDLKG